MSIERCSPSKRAELVTQSGYYFDRLKFLPLLPGNVREFVAEKSNRFVRNHTFGAIPHLGIGLIYSELTNLGFDVRIHDLNEIINNPRVEKHFLKAAAESDLVGISVLDMGVDLPMGLLTKLDLQKVVVGGLGATFSEGYFRKRYPKLTIISGEAEGLIEPLVDDLFTNRQLEERYQREKPFNFNEEFNPDRNRRPPHLIPEYSFRKLSLFRLTFDNVIEVSRGCRESCSFCHSGNRPLTVKPLAMVEEELKLIQKLKIPGSILFFVDQDLFSCELDYLINLFTMVNQMGMRWAGEGTIMKGINNEKLMRLMTKNCFSFLVGVEDLFNKVPGSKSKTELRVNLEEHVKQLREFKFPIAYSLMVGLDSQDKSVFEKTAQKVLELGISPLIHIATPRPGTRWYEQLKRDGRIKDSYSVHRDMRSHVVFEPAKMSREEVLMGYTWLHNVLFTPKRIRQRFFRNLKDCGPQYALGLLVTEAIGFICAQRLAKKYPGLLKEGIATFKL